jgi:hypothetical protein
MVPSSMAKHECDRRVVRALSIGPAASLALSAGALRVHSVFRSTVNLEAGSSRFAALCGPRGRRFPHAIALERQDDFEAWRLAVGTRARLAGGSLELPVEGATVVVGLEQAERTPARALAAIPQLGNAHRACVLRLAALQRESACDLRIDALHPRGGRATTPVGARLRDVALTLGAAARAFARRGGPEAHASLRHATVGVVGLGAGLTPSGDDFLCGFLAAAHASASDASDASNEHGRNVGGGSALIDALDDATAESVGRTVAVSAFFVRCAIEGFWPAPLLDLAEALAGEREPEALAALAELCSLGHGSGCDLSTGFLFGLASLAA